MIKCLLLLPTHPDIDVSVRCIAAKDVWVTKTADTDFTFQHIARVAGSYSEPFHRCGSLA